MQSLTLLLLWPFLFFLPFQLSAVGAAPLVWFYLEDPDGVVKAQTEAAQSVPADFLLLPLFQIMSLKEKQSIHHVIQSIQTVSQN